MMCKCAASIPPDGEWMAREFGKMPWIFAARYSSLPRVTAIEASVLVRVHSMLSRR
jgi:hypothetical protein